MTPAPLVDPNDHLTADQIAELCDADWHARRFLGIGPAEVRVPARATVRVYGDVLPGDDLDDLDDDQ